MSCSLKSETWGGIMVKKLLLMSVLFFSMESVYGKSLPAGIPLKKVAKAKCMMGKIAGIKIDTCTPISKMQTRSLSKKITNKSCKAKFGKRSKLSGSAFSASHLKPTKKVKVYKGRLTHYNMTSMAQKICLVYNGMSSISAAPKLPKVAN